MNGLVACEKRRAERSEDPNNPPPISKLGDDVLEEILIRLPDPRSAVQCKIVSKKWCSVVSNPYFFRRCIQFRKEQAAAKEEDLVPPCPEYVRLSILSFIPISDTIFGCNARQQFEVYNCAEGDNLFLCGFPACSRSDELSRRFFVCNRGTKQWIALPLSPEAPYARYPMLLPTLVCEPCSDSVDLDLGGGETFVYSEYRFRVLCMHYLPAEGGLRLDVYCSESPGGWTSHDVGIQLWRLFPCENLEIQVFRGKLYWINCRIKKVFEFDPFRFNQNRPCVLDASSVFPEGEDKATSNLWISQGHLHIVRVLSPTSFSVWRLQCELWMQQCEVTLDTLKWTSARSFRMHLPGRYSGSLFEKLCDQCSRGKLDPETELGLGKVIGLHPTDPQVLYFRFNRLRKRSSDCPDNGFGVVCNLRTRTLQVFAAMYQRDCDSGRRWTTLFKRPRLSCNSSSSYWPAQLRNFRRLRGMYNIGQ